MRRKAPGNTDLSINQPEPNVFTGECYASSGEKVYLRMELLTEKNKSSWSQYTACTLRFSKIRSLVGDMPFFIDEITLANGCKEYLYDFGDKKEFILEKSGFSGDEFNQFIQLMGKNGFHKNGEHRKLLWKTTGGADHMCTSTAGGGHRFIVYASKSPDFLITDVPKIDLDGLTIKDYITLYRDILISIGSDFSQLQSFRNRGIFRNPYNLIENTHKGLAMALHGFSGAIAKLFFPEMTCMEVEPVKAMYSLIKKSLNQDDIIVVGGPSLYGEASLKIKIPALVDLYQKHQLPPPSKQLDNK